MKKLNRQTLQSIAYSQNASSFVFLDSEINDLINAIYLYGSAARGELEKESDIDLFIDCNTGHEKDVEGIAKAALSRFYQSKDYEKWKRYKFQHPISIQAGELKTWQLKISILGEGIQLYAKNPIKTTTQRQVLFVCTLPKEKKAYLRFARILFGRKETGYKDQGLLGQTKGRKLSSNVILIAQENQQPIADFLKKEKVDYYRIEVGVFR